MDISEIKTAIDKVNSTLLDGLTPLERHIFKHRLIGDSRNSLAAELKTSEECVKQYEIAAINKIKANLEGFGDN